MTRRSIWMMLLPTLAFTLACADDPATVESQAVSDVGVTVSALTSCPPSPQCWPRDGAVCCLGPGGDTVNCGICEGDDCPLPEIVTGDHTGGDACYAYEHINFDGERIGLGVGQIYHYVGDDFNDIISSFRVAPGAYIVAWDNRDEGGDTITFPSDAYSVGEWMNDRISSFVCRRCE